MSILLSGPRWLIQVFQRYHFERIKRREERGSSRQWFLLCGPADQQALLAPQPATLRKLTPPADRFWADPFVWGDGGRRFIFCEEWLEGQPHGHISALELSSDSCEVRAVHSVLHKEHHLSYPFLFSYAGALYLLPEGGAGRSLDVYRCERFPDRWQKQATLMRGLRYADPTLLEHGGRWWLFLTLKRGPYSMNRDLFLFHADSPLSDQWTPHPANPVVRGFERARPAGRLFELGGALYRPSQNSLRRYGYGLRLNRVLRLDPEGYAEEPVTELLPDWEPGLRGNHHIDWAEGFLAMDAQRLVPNLSASSAKPPKSEPDV